MSQRSQIDIFEQQFRSISKIDFMERYLSEVKNQNQNPDAATVLTASFTVWKSCWWFASHTQKEYLIIIIISPKYYETVTASPGGLENDERTFNTVYIHKQVF